ncbi:YARHG domain-containing protein [Bacillus sp. sid0103]|nr:YARHG domain-containing protein [Bacillus sp. sid0103]
MARNEIYARHGHIFKKGSLQIYFDRKSCGTI